MEEKSEEKCSHCGASNNHPYLGEGWWSCGTAKKQLKEKRTIVLGKERSILCYHRENENLKEENERLRKVLACCWEWVDDVSENDLTESGLIEYKQLMEDIKEFKPNA